MPLKKGKSRAAISQNIRTEMAHGKSHDQAVAIAMREAGMSRQHKRVHSKKKKGGRK